VRAALPPRPGAPARIDHEYVRNGVANIFMLFEPLAARRHVTITERHTRIDWARLMKDLVDTHYPDAEKIVLVCDNLNTHEKASLYEAFDPKEAKRVAEKLEIHYTPKHGSWLNVAECELSVLSRQCLNRRIPDRKTLAREVAQWNQDRNNRSKALDWRFTVEHARIKMESLYPSIQM
jgi:transposase